MKAVLPAGDYIPAPAMLAVDRSSNVMKGREGEILRLTFPIGQGCTLIIGVLALILSGFIN